MHCDKENNFYFFRLILSVKKQIVVTTRKLLLSTREIFLQILLRPVVIHNAIKYNSNAGTKKYGPLYEQRPGGTAKK